MQVVAGLRGWGFGQTTQRGSAGIVGFASGTNVGWVWALTDYQGFPTWVRRTRGPTRGDGSDP